MAARVETVARTARETWQRMQASFDQFDSSPGKRNIMIRQTSGAKLRKVLLMLRAALESRSGVALRKWAGRLLQYPACRRLVSVPIVVVVAVAIASARLLCIGALGIWPTIR